MTMTGDTTAEYLSAFKTPASLSSDVTSGFAPLFADYGGGMMGAGAPGAGGLQDLLIRGMGPQTKPGHEGFVASSMPPTTGLEKIAGNAFPQLLPKAQAGQTMGGGESIPSPANQASVMGVRTQPTGAEWPAGPVVKNNYSNLNGLKNQAYGVNYG